MLVAKRQHRQQRRRCAFHDLRTVRGASQLQQTVVDDADRFVAVDLRLLASGYGVEEGDVGRCLQALVAGDVRGEPGAGRIAVRGHAVAEHHQPLGAQYLRHVRFGDAEAFGDRAALFPVAEGDLRARHDRRQHRIGGCVRHLREGGRHLLQ